MDYTGNLKVNFDAGMEKEMAVFVAELVRQGVTFRVEVRATESNVFLTGGY